MSNVTLVPYRHCGGAFSAALPAGWEQVTDPAPGVALVALEPASDAGFRANLVVTVDDVPGRVDRATWQAGVEQTLAATLHDYLLLDLETLDPPPGAGASGGWGAPVVRRLAHHLVGDAEAVTMHQWACLRAGTGFTLTASAATLAYDAVADAFDAVAATFHIDARSDPGPAR